MFGNTKSYNTPQNYTTVEIAKLRLDVAKLIAVVTSGTGSSATLAEQQTQTTQLTGINANTLSLLNNLVASQDVEILLVRDEGALPNPIVVQQIREYDQGTGVWTTRYETVSGTPYVPVGALVYLDPSAVSNLMLAELQNILAKLDVDLSTRASEATLQAVETLLTAIDTVLDNIKLDTANLDIALSTMATEATLSAIETLVTTIDVVLDAIKLDTTNLDVALSTRATEATLQEVTTDLDKKARYYFDIFLDTFGQGGVVNSFPFTIDIFEYVNGLNFSRQYFIPATVVNSTAEVVALWNANVPDAIMSVRDSNTIWFDPRQGVEFDFGTGGHAVDAIVIGHTVGYGLLLWQGLTDPLIGSTYYGFYEDTILSESNLDWMLIELQRQSKIVATVAKQDELITAIGNQVDYEVLQCYGRDSAIYVDWTMTPSSNTLTRYTGLPSDPAPGESIVPSWDSYGLSQDNNSWYAEITIDKDFSAVDAVDILLDTEFVAGAGNWNNTVIELRETAGDTLLATQIGMLTVPVGTTQSFGLTYDNSSTNYPELKLRIIPNGGGGVLFATGTTSYDNFQVLDSVLTDPTQAIIQRVDKYENNVLISTEYFDYSGAPYTLTGTFMKDASLEATSLLKESLGTIAVSTARTNDLLSHNTHTSFILPLGALPTAYTGFKELTFVVISGTAIIQVGTGGLLTYPIAVDSGGVITGQTIKADDADISGIQIDPTLGDVLVTIKT